MAKSPAVEAAPPSALVRLATLFNQADEAVEESKKKLSEAQIRKIVAEKKLVEEMITQSIRAFRTPFGGFRSEATVRPNVKAEDKEKMQQYVKRHKSLAFLYTVSIHGGKFKTWVKECLEQGKELPEFIDPGPVTVIRRFS